MTLADIIKQEILSDEIRKLIPLCPDFSTLHSFVDANEYIIVAMEKLGVDYDPSDEMQAAFLNAATAEVSDWLHDRFQAHHKALLAGTFPMPNNQVQGRTVVASCYLSDDEACLLLLNPVPAYYTVARKDLTSGALTFVSDFENIVPATEFYNELGGCY